MARAQKKRSTKARRESRPISQEEVSREAFRLYQARHGAPGDPVADWLEAERIVRARSGAKPAAARATKPAARRFRTTSRRK